jgi:transcriptional regulator with XRE-family HTH domain
MTEIRRLREYAGLTQFETARLAKVDRSRLALAEGDQLPLSQEQETRLRSALLRAIRNRRDRLTALLERTNAQRLSPAKCAA